MSDWSKNFEVVFQDEEGKLTTLNKGASVKFYTLSLLEQAEKGLKMTC